MLNLVALQGRLVRDPELRTTQNGLSTCTFCIAVNRQYKNKETGQYDADFINCVAWRQTAEFVSRYFTKGTTAIVDGSLQSRKYTDKEGNSRTTMEVIANNVNFAGSRKELEGQGGGSYGGGSQGGYGGQRSRGNGGGQNVPKAYAQNPNVSADDFSDLDDEDSGNLPF